MSCNYSISGEYTCQVSKVENFRNVGLPKIVGSVGLPKIGGSVGLPSRYTDDVKAAAAKYAADAADAAAPAKYAAAPAKYAADAAAYAADAAVYAAAPTPPQPQCNCLPGSNRGSYWDTCAIKINDPSGGGTVCSGGIKSCQCETPAQAAPCTCNGVLNGEEYWDTKANCIRFAGKNLCSGGTAICQCQNATA